jgi:hypothetical protein
MDTLFHPLFESLNSSPDLGTSLAPYSHSFYLQTTLKAQPHKIPQPNNNALHIQNLPPKIPPNWWRLTLIKPLNTIAAHSLNPHWILDNDPSSP